jgi:uncharacterized protein (DUF924 family)
MATAEDVLHFWFEESTPKKWFTESDKFDAQIKTRFGADYDIAAKGGDSDWRGSASGCIALCILLDQFPRNMFRDDPKSFATDPLARNVARDALEQQCYVKDWLTDDHRCFLYLPLEHSEEMEDQRLSLRLFKERTENERYIDYARRHLVVIERFGGFPHRNKVLGRESTAEEIEFLKQN